MCVYTFFFAPLGIHRILQFIRKAREALAKPMWKRERKRNNFAWNERRRISKTNLKISLCKFVRISHSFAKCWWVNAKTSELICSQQSRHNRQHFFYFEQTILKRLKKIWNSKCYNFFFHYSIVLISLPQTMVVIIAITRLCI